MRPRACCWLSSPSTRKRSRTCCGRPAEPRVSPASLRGGRLGCLAFPLGQPGDIVLPLFFLVFGQPPFGFDFPAPVQRGSHRLNGGIQLPGLLVTFGQARIFLRLRSEGNFAFLVPLSLVFDNRN